MSTYKDAGVDIEKADTIVQKISSIQQANEESTGRSLFETFGQFASSYDLSEYDQPVLVTTCDGVGTKIILQKRHGKLEHAGQDLVAMNINDLLTLGADPLLFLDYVAMAPLDEEIIMPLVQGISSACEEANCILAGGETAELPDMVEPGDIELSGFCAGVVEKEYRNQVNQLEEGDQLIGIPSNGFHANGFSLVRKILSDHPDLFDDTQVESLLSPTRIYYDSVQKIIDHGIRPGVMVHVTGGGIRGNLNRVLPEQLGARVEIPEWDHETIRKILNFVDLDEAIRTFNMGIGWILALDQTEATKCKSILKNSVEIGSIHQGDLEVTIN